MKARYCYLTLRYLMNGELFGTGNTSTSTRGADWILEDHARKFKACGMVVEVVGTHYIDHPQMSDFQAV